MSDVLIYFGILWGIIGAGFVVCWIWRYLWRFACDWYELTERGWLLLLVILPLTGCAYMGKPAPYLDTKIVWQNDDGSDWMLRPEREWIDETNNPRFHVHLGLEWAHNIDCPYIATGTDALEWLHFGCAKTWEWWMTEDTALFFQFAVIHSSDKYSHPILSTDQKRWQGHNPFGHWRLGIKRKSGWFFNVATGRSIFQGAPFESEDNNPDLYWFHAELGYRLGGKK